MSGQNVAAYTRTTVPCVYGCGQELLLSVALIEVIGWTHKRAQGGTNSIRGAKPTHRYAHRNCVDTAAILGVTPKQEGLFG